MKLKLCLSCSKNFKQQIPSTVFISTGLKEFSFFSHEFLSQRLEYAKNEREEIMNVYKLNKKAFKISNKHKEEIIEEISRAIDRIVVGYQNANESKKRKSLPNYKDLNSSDIFESSKTQLSQIKIIEYYIDECKTKIQELESYNKQYNEELEKESTFLEKYKQESVYTNSDQKLVDKISILKDKLKECKQERIEVETKLKSCKESYEKKIMKYKEDIKSANDQKEIFEYEARQIKIVYNDLISNNVKFQEQEKETWLKYKESDEELNKLKRKLEKSEESNLKFQQIIDRFKKEVAVQKEVEYLVKENESLKQKVEVLEDQAKELANKLKKKKYETADSQYSDFIERLLNNR